MGVVYAAHDDRLDRPVAIKRIREASGDANPRERLLREARAAASLSHPKLCHVYELAEEAGELYLVMELLVGEPLAERIVREAVPLAEALQITLGILGALEALHARGMVHRDLKPSNVFLTPHGVQLLDSGSGTGRRGGPASLRRTGRRVSFLRAARCFTRRGPARPAARSGHSDQRAVHALGIG